MRIYVFELGLWVLKNNIDELLVHWIRAYCNKPYLGNSVLAVLEFTPSGKRGGGGEGVLLIAY